MILSGRKLQQMKNYYIIIKYFVVLGLLIFITNNALSDKKQNKIEEKHHINLDIKSI